MKKTRMDYESPVTELFVVRYEKRFCQSTNEVQPNGIRRSNINNELLDDEYSYN